MAHLHVRTRGLASPIARGVLAVLCFCAVSCSGAQPKTGNNDSELPGKPVDLELFVRNNSDSARTQTMLASVPFPEGAVKSLESYGVQDHATSWRVLQRWGDGSIRVAQAQFTDTVEPRSRQDYRVAKDVIARQGPFQAHPWTQRKAATLAFVPEVFDDDNVAYRATIANGGEVRHESHFVRTRFWRVYLRNSNANAGIRRDFLTARLYLTEFRDMPFVVAELVLGNEYLGADDPKGSKDPNMYPLGPVSFKRAMLHVTGGASKMRHRDKNDVAAPAYNASTDTESYTLLQNTHIDDGATKYWNVVVYLEDKGAGKTERDGWRRTWEAEVAEPMRAMATLKTWQDTEALGINGGVATGPKDAYERAEAELNSWNGRNHFGAYGAWGDIKFTHTTGTPRNGPLTWVTAHIVQSENPRLMAALEGAAWQQSLRQYHVWGLDIEPDDDIYTWWGLRFGVDQWNRFSNQTLGRAKFWGWHNSVDPYAHWRQNVPKTPGHGWNPFDAEHATSDIVFDYYTLSGSFWAQDEMQMLGEWCEGVMRIKDYFTARIIPARAEGWCMQVLVQAYVATGNEGFKRHSLRRIEEIVEPNRHKNHATRAIYYQDNWDRTPYPPNTLHAKPWEHAAVALGFLGAHKFFGSETALRIAEDVVHLTDYAHVENSYDPRTKRTYDFEIRYFIPTVLNCTYKGKVYKDFDPPITFFDSDPEIGTQVGGGTSVFLLCPMYYVAQRTKNPSIRARALYLGDRLLGKIGDRSVFWTQWACAVPEAAAPDQRP